MSSYLANYQYKAWDTVIPPRKEKRLSMDWVVLSLIIPGIYILPVVAILFWLYFVGLEFLLFLELPVLGVLLYVHFVLSMLGVIPHELRFKGKEYSFYGFHAAASFVALIALFFFVFVLLLISNLTHSELCWRIAEVFATGPVFWFTTGILSLVFVVSLAERDIEIKEALCGNYASNVKPSISLFRKESKLLSLKSFQVIQIMSTGDALALCTEETDEDTFLYAEGPAVLLLKDGYNLYKDNRVITLPKGKIAKQVGKFTYKTEERKIICVPVISIMEIDSCGGVL